MTVIGALRPVEALYLLSLSRRECLSKENALAATLAYLSGEKYIRLVNDNLLPDAKIFAREGLRPYEAKCLDTIVQADGTMHAGAAEKLLFAAGGFDFRVTLAKEGFLVEKENTKKRTFLRFLTVSLPKTVYYTTDNYQKALQELDDLRQKIGSCKPESLDGYMKSMSHAFPSSFRTRFHEYSEKLSDEVARSKPIIFPVG